MKELKLVKSLPPSVSPVPMVMAILSQRLDQGRQLLNIEFNVSNSKLNAKATYAKDESVWGLWDSDVCELFVSSAQDESLVSKAAYYEFQVSPFAQYFELKILEPRKLYDEKFRSGLAVTAKIRTTQAWAASIAIPYEALGLDPLRPVYGNVCACLLREPHRAYLAYNHDASGVPDYHRPDRFIKLIG